MVHPKIAAAGAQLHQQSRLATSQGEMPELREQSDFRLDTEIAHTPLCHPCPNKTSVSPTPRESGQTTQIDAVQSVPLELYKVAARQCLSSADQVEFRVLGEHGEDGFEL